ncbi:hypothetical protein HN873_069873, partial [Arachis hypogaea]
SNAARNKKKIFILLPVAVSLTSTIVVLALWFIIKTWQRNGVEKEDLQFNDGRGSRSERNEYELPLFEIAIIEAATMNFSVYNKIGEGGFGLVYK